MILGLVTAATFLGINLLAVPASIWIDRHGLPDDVSSQTARRKPGDLARRAPVIALNLVLVAAGSVVGIWAISGFLRPAWPGLATFAAQFALLLLLDDLVFYAVHRVMHEVPALYRRFHAHHHRAYAPVPIELLYTHPAETTLVTLGIGAAGAVLVAIWGFVSFPALLAYQAFRQLHELDVHSGIRSNLAHAVPFLAPNEHHDLHHHKPNIGNYASMLTVWDRVFGTYVEDTRRATWAIAPVTLRAADVPRREAA